MGGVALLLGLLALLGIVLALLRGGDDDTATTADSAKQGKAAPAQAPPPTLPGGKRRIFPDYRVVAFYGNPAADELGVLGIGKPDAAVRRLTRQAKGYARKSRPVMPALELITTIANAHPGQNGLYRARMPDKTIRRYYRAARKAKALLLLDIQPGRSDFFEETIRLEKWLRRPDVGLALDPEWRVQAGQVPGKVIGSVTAREVNATTAWLDMLIEKHRLPQKLVVIHQFTIDMISDRERLKPRKNLAIVLNADGFGDRPNKLAKYQAFTQGPKKFLHGFKLFYREDVGLMSPKQVMRMKPRPDFVVYE